MEYSKLLEEAESAKLNYPDMIRPAKVWRIKENVKLMGYHGSNYLSFSFVMEKNVKLKELGFNMILNSSLNQRPLAFLSEEDAKQFFDIYKNKYPDINWNRLEVSGGRGGNDLIRINKEGSIPVYGTKSNVEYLLRYEDNKVPEYVKARLKGEISVAQNVLDKEAKQKELADKAVILRKNLGEVIKGLPGLISVEDKADILEPKDGEQKYYKPTFDVTFNLNIGDPSITMRFTAGKKIELLWAKIDGITLDGVYEDIYGEDWKKSGYIGLYVPLDLGSPIGERQRRIGYPGLTFSSKLTKEEIENKFKTYLTNVSSFIKSANEFVEL